MREVRRILVAIKDPAARSLTSLSKIAQLARTLEAEVELFHCLAEPVVIDLLAQPEIREDQLKHSRQQAVLDQLEGTAVMLRVRGATVTCAAIWDYPPHEAIVRRATSIGADLIIVDRHAGARRVGWLRSFTDLELLRVAPCPVLVVTTPDTYHRPRILAAVDPFRAHGKPEELNQEILRAAGRVANLFGGDLHVLYARRHATPTAAQIYAEGAWQASANAWPSDDDIRRRIDQEVARLGFPQCTQHLVDGAPVDAIAAAARDFGTNIVVMGESSRAGLRRLLVGNTAEKALDRLPCDVLIVKPQEFRPSTPQQVRGARVRNTGVAGWV